MWHGACQHSVKRGKTAITYRLTFFPGVRDLDGLCDAIKDAHTKWFEIGMELKLGQLALQQLRDNPGNSSVCLKKMLRLWLIRVDPLPTTTALSNALRRPTIRYPVAASNVDRYLNGEPQNLRPPPAESSFSTSKT